MDEMKKPEDIVKAVESVESSLPELPEAELNQVVGGTKPTDKASPILMNVCATGKHYDEAK
jgi:type VI protein secretion system component Hcp